MMNQLVNRDVEVHDAIENQRMVDALDEYNKLQGN